MMDRSTHTTQTNTKSRQEQENLSTPTPSSSTTLLDCDLRRTTPPNRKMDGQKKNVNSYADLSSDQLRKLLEERDETIKSIDEMIKSIEMIKEDTVQKIARKREIAGYDAKFCLPPIHHQK